MKILLIPIIILIATGQYCTSDSQCTSCCDIKNNKCDICFCSTSYTCSTKCCIGGVCKPESYCMSCSSHEECDSKCCLQGNCNDASLCPYYPIGVACAYDYQCVSYQCSSSICVDIVGTICFNHTDCPTKCCYNGMCQLAISSLCSAKQINMTCLNNWDCDTYLCKLNRCVALLTGRCYTHEDCESSCCIDSRCKIFASCSMMSARSPCEQDYECFSNRCLNSKCLSKTGEKCFNHTECDYKCCINGECSLKCKYLKIGALCTSNGDCSSYICKSGLCVGEDGSNCAHHLQCKSAFCMNNYCSSNFIHQKNLSPGDTCLGSYECKEYFCLNKTCLSVKGGICHDHYDCTSECCFESKCALEGIPNCNSIILGIYCIYNWECKSSICSNHYCLGDIGTIVKSHSECASMCSINQTCMNTSLCIHKNAGELCALDSECITNQCNDVCLGNLGDMCLTHYNCIVNPNTKYYNKTCENHICKEIFVNNPFCEVNEDCFYGYDNIYYGYAICNSLTCKKGKCLSSIGTKYYKGNCDSGCVIDSNCEQYSYCAQREGQSCTTHKDCIIGCCYYNETLGQSLCSARCLNLQVAQLCNSHYDCLSFYCNSTTNACDNRPCTYHQECMAGCCNNGKCSNSCNLLSVLSICHNNYECKSNLCSLEKCKLDLWYPCMTFEECLTGCCSSGVCKTNTGENCPFKNSFEQCNHNFECKSNACNPNTKICLSKIGEVCAHHKDCSSGCCGRNLTCFDNSDSNNCQLFGILHDCNASFECSSFICSSNYCKINVSESCNNHENCVTNYCNQYMTCSESNSSLIDGGNACTMNAQCKSYICENGICKLLIGNSCNIHSDCISGCCGSGEICLANPDNQICKSLEAGTICDYNYDCKSSICSYICKLHNGENCSKHLHCISGYCKRSTGKCEQNPCSSDECIYNDDEYCIDHKSCNSKCCYQAEICKPQSSCENLPSGWACTQNYQCASFDCIDSNCDGKENIKACDSHSDCDSKCCDANRHCSFSGCSPKLANALSCSSNYMCESYLCNNKVCQSYAISHSLAAVAWKLLLVMTIFIL